MVVSEIDSARDAETSGRVTPKGGLSMLNQSTTSPEEKRRRAAAYMRRWMARQSPEQRAKRIAQISGWRRQRKARDPEFRARLLKQSNAGRTPERHRASVAVRQAVCSGKLIKPMLCESCSQPGPIEAAHEDYSRRFDVRWLCRPCHRRWDAKFPKGGYIPLAERKGREFKERSTH
jgi:hypothetical protein